MKARALTKLELSLAAAAILLLLALLEALLLDIKDSLFPFFYAWVGFAVTVTFIAVARMLRPLLQRPGTYYKTEEKDG